MDKKTTAILEKFMERKLENEKKERLQRIQDTLRIDPNDAHLGQYRGNGIYLPQKTRV